MNSKTFQELHLGIFKPDDSYENCLKRVKNEPCGKIAEELHYAHRRNEAKDERIAELEKKREKANFAVVPRKLTKGMRIAYHESIERHENCEDVIGCPDDQWAVMIKQYESEALKEGK